MNKFIPAETALCPHFGECGGCATQDIPYAKQLEGKAEILRELFLPYWTEPIPIQGSPEVWHYRNKVDFNFARKHYEEPPPPGFERETVLGFNRKGKWYWPLDISECLIAPQGADALLNAVRQWAKSQGLGAYDQRSGEGLLRVLLVRAGRRTGQAMVVLVTRSGPMDAAAFVQAVRGVFPASPSHGLEARATVSIYRAIHDGAAQGAFAESLELLWGVETIEEELHVPAGSGEIRKLRFRISPMSFFQTNTLATELLYSEIRKWMRGKDATVLYDLYGGSGGIAFSLSDLVPVVRSVENVAAATADGEANARLNGITNVFFSAENVKDYLQNVLATGGMEQGAVAVADPPRAGMHPKARKRLIACAPRHILYVSCKPSVLAQELPEFLEAYVLRDLRAVDLFPHTPHVELLAALERR